MSLIAIDLFSGCGGLTTGLRQAGFRVVGAVDNEPLAVATFKMNHRTTVVWTSDIQDLTVGAVKRRLGLRNGGLDLLAGCPPCQGFSSMRTLNGKRVVRDARNDLVFDFLRFVEGLLPKAVMMENVPGLAGDRRMTQFARELKRLGYEGEARVLNARDFGVPQRRRRMIFIAVRRGYSLQFPAASPEHKSVRDAIEALPKCGTSGDPLHDLVESRSEKVRKLIGSIPKDGGSRGDLGPLRQLECHKRLRGFHDVYGRMAWDDVAPTITGGFVNPSKGRFLHPEEDRCVTLREAALLQSFPADYAFSLERGKFPAAQMIGNALPPEFIRRHAASLAQALRKGKVQRGEGRRS